MEGVNVAHSYVRSEVRGPHSRSLSPPHLARSSPSVTTTGANNGTFVPSDPPTPSLILPPRADILRRALPRMSTLTWFTTRCVGWTASRATLTPNLRRETRTSSSRRQHASSPCAASSPPSPPCPSTRSTKSTASARSNEFFYSYVWGEPKAMAVAKRFDVVRRRGVGPPRSRRRRLGRPRPRPHPRTRSTHRTRDRTTNHDRRVHREAHRVRLFARGVDDATFEGTRAARLPEDGRVHRGTHRARLLAFHGGDDRGGDRAGVVSYVLARRARRTGPVVESFATRDAPIDDEPKPERGWTLRRPRGV